MIRGMNKIDKASVWAMFTQMRLRCFLEYVCELEDNQHRNNLQEQIYSCACDFLTTNPAEILKTIDS